MGRPITTLFMLMSVDGKISTGATDELDFDQDFPRIEGVREGLHCVPSKYGGQALPLSSLPQHQINPGCVYGTRAEMREGGPSQCTQ